MNDYPKIVKKPMDLGTIKTTRGARDPPPAALLRRRPLSAASPPSPAAAPPALPSPHHPPTPQPLPSQNRDYEDSSGFIDDVRLVWSNRILYNPVGDPTRLAAERLSAVFEDNLRSLTDPARRSKRERTEAAAPFAPAPPPPRRAVRAAEACGRARGEPVRVGGGGGGGAAVGSPR